MKGIVRKAANFALANPICGAMLKGLWDGRASIFLLHRLYDEAHASDGTLLRSITESIRALRGAGATFVSVRDLVTAALAGRPPRPGSVAFTIDDGYADQGTLAREFIRNDCPVSIFLISGFIDGTNWAWDEKLAYCVGKSTATQLLLPNPIGALQLTNASLKQMAVDRLQRYVKSLSWDAAEALLSEIYRGLGVFPPEEPPSHCTPMNWDEIRKLESEGVEFGPHSVTHRVASSLSSVDSYREISDSWARLQEELRNPLPVYAWPTGRSCDYRASDVAAARSVGLAAALATNDNYANFAATEEPHRLYALDRFAFAPEADINLQYGTIIERLKSRTRAAFA